MATALESAGFRGVDADVLPLRRRDSGGDLGKAIQAPWRAVLLHWWSARPQGVARLSVGEMEAEARSTEKAERFWRRAPSFARRRFRTVPYDGSNFEQAGVGLISRERIARGESGSRGRAYSS